MITEVGRIFQVDVPMWFTPLQQERQRDSILSLKGVSSLQWSPMRTLIIEARRDNDADYEALKREIQHILK